MKQSFASKSPTHARQLPTVTKLFWMGHGKTARGTQQQHKKATPRSSPCQNERTTSGMEFLHIYGTRGTYQYSAGILALMQKHVDLSVFNLMLVRYLPGLGISEMRDLFFRGPIWIGLRNGGNCCVGQVPETSHVATRPKKHTRICPSLSRPFAAGPASSLFLVVQSVLDVIRMLWYGLGTVSYTHLTLPTICSV